MPYLSLTCSLFPLSLSLSRAQTLAALRCPPSRPPHRAVAAGRPTTSHRRHELRLAALQLPRQRPLDGRAGRELIARFPPPLSAARRRRLRQISAAPELL